MSYKPVFDPPAVMAVNEIIFSQDILMTGIADCLYNLEIQEYDEFKQKFRAIPIITDELIKQCRALLFLKKGQGGQKPKWFQWGEDVLYLGLNLQRTMPKFRRENRGNDWEVIASRLEECQRQCDELKAAIRKIMPPPDLGANPLIPRSVEVNSGAVAEWNVLVKTAQSGGIVLDAEGFRYRGGSR